jgi:HEAT repeat protein
MIKTDTIKRIMIWVFVFAVTVFDLCPTASAASSVGPYTGVVVDSATGKPLAGASVLITWVACPKTLMVRRLGVVKEELLTTDQQGRYHLAKTLIDPQPLIKSLLAEDRKLDERIRAALADVRLEVQVTIYQFGYLVHIVDPEDRRDDLRPPFNELDAVIKLDRIPPNFNHQHHYRNIETRMDRRSDVPPSFSPQGEALLSQVRWENRRSDHYQEPRGKTTAFDPKTVNGLKTANVQVRREIAGSLAFCKDERAVAVLIECLRDPDASVRLEAAYALGEIKARNAFQPLLDLVDATGEWPHPLVQQEALTALRKIASPDIVVIEQTRDGKVSTLQRLGEFDPQGIAKFTSVLIRKFHDEYLKAEIIRAFQQFKVVEAAEPLNNATRHPDEQIRKLAVSALSMLSASRQGDTRTSERLPDPVPALIESLRDASATVRAASATELGRLGDSRAVEALLQAARDNDRQVRDKTIEALGKFNDERIFSVLASLLGESELAAKQFEALAQRTCKQRVYCYRKDGKRFVTAESPAPYPATAKTITYQGNKYEARMLHPTGVESLKNALDNPNARLKSGALASLCLFEDPGSLQIAVGMLKDPSPTVRKAALKVLSCVGDDAAVAHAAALLQDQDQEVRQQAIRTLAELQPGNMQNYSMQVMETLNDQDPRVRTAAVKALGKSDDPLVLEALLGKVDDKDGVVREAVLASLALFDDPRVVDLFLKLLMDCDLGALLETIKNHQAKPDKRAVAPPVEQIRRVTKCEKGTLGQAIKYQQTRPDKRAVEPLIQLLNDPDQFICSTAAAAMGAGGDPRAVDPLIQAVRTQPGEDPKDTNRSFALRSTAIEALGKIGDPRAAPVLMEAVADKRLTVFAIRSLGMIKDQRAFDVVRHCLEDDRSAVREASVAALTNIGGAGTLDVFKSLLNDPGKNSPGKDILISAIAGIQDDKAVDVLIELLNCPNKEIVFKVIKTLGEIKNRRSIQPLVRIAGKRTETFFHIGRALQAFNLPELTDILVGHLDSEDEMIQQGAIILLGEIKDPKAIPALEQHLGDANPEIKKTLERALSTIRFKGEAMPGQMQAGVQQLSGRQIGIIAKDPSVAMDPKYEPVFRQLGNKQVKILTPQQVGQSLEELKSKDPQVRQKATDSLGASGDPKAAEQLVDLLSNPEEYVRQAAAGALTKLLQSGPTVSRTVIFNKVKSIADRGSAESQRVMAYLSDPGPNGIPQPDEALKWYRAAAENGDPVAQHTLGNVYSHGSHGVWRDKNEAVRWFEKAAQEGHVKAQSALAELSFHEGDHEGAVKWFRMAAESGDPVSQATLGGMYKRGPGVPQDYQQAVKWYRMAAEQDYVPAQRELAIMYEQGLGVMMDYREAEKWYRQAADANGGMPAMQLDLGKFYERCRQDYQQAAQWYQKALDGKDERARDALRKLMDRQKQEASQSQPDN